MFEPAIYHIIDLSPSRSVILPDLCQRGFASASPYLVDFFEDYRLRPFAEHGDLVNDNQLPAVLLYNLVYLVVPCIDCLVWINCAVRIEPEQFRTDYTRLCEQPAVLCGKREMFGRIRGFGNNLALYAFSRAIGTVYQYEHSARP